MGRRRGGPPQRRVPPPLGGEGARFRAPSALLHPPVNALPLVALGGALGASARYGLALASARLFGPDWPVGTWAANVLGCFLIGLAIPLLVTDRARLGVVTGFLGAFTTFSTYSAETVGLWESGRLGLAAANALGSVVAGLAAVAAGLAVARALA